MFLRNFLLSLGISSLVVATPISTNSTRSSSLPTIDLGYAVHRASHYNESYDAYVFSNIRFAAPPTGALRFGLPQAPLKNRAINDGSVGFSCPQAEAGYLPYAGDAGLVSEDCLFLDVIVPRKVLSGDFGKVPVLFWIYGGAYTLGSKTMMGDPTNFLKDSPSPVIWVAPNYRLGIFGFLGGPSFTLSSGTVPNAGLYDQKFALQWVQDNIHIFNGQKDEVTVMGASAGAGSIMHHIIANGGEGDAPLFKRAIPIGPGYLLTGGHSNAEETFSDLESRVGCSGKGVDCIRSLPTEVLMKANTDMITILKAPRVGPGPTVDGNLVPDAPAYLLAQGRFHKNITILVSDDIDEGFMFVNTISFSSLSESIADIFPETSDAVRNQLMALYPTPSSSTPYTTNLDQLGKLFADTAFNCNRYALSTAFPDTTYNVIFSIQPGYHGTSPTLIFTDSPWPGSEQDISAKIQYEMRRFVMNFIVSGNPNEANGKGVSNGVVWPVFGSKGVGLDVSGHDMKVVSATMDKEVCEWWTKSLVLS